METLEIIYIIISFVFGVFVSPYLKRTIENIADTHWSYRKEKAKMKSDIANNIDKQLFRLLIKAQYEERYKTDKNAKKIIELHKDFDNLKKDSECNRRIEEPEYYRIANEVYKYSDKILQKKFPKW